MNASRRPVPSVKPSSASSSEAPFEITIFRNRRGNPLTKEISLGPNGKPVSDGSACVMSAGHAKRQRVSLVQLAEVVAGLESCEALALGSLRSDLPDGVEIVVKGKLDAASTGQIARSSDFISYQPGQPAFVLLDVDLKGMPGSVRERLRGLGGLTAALQAVLPAIGDAGRVSRRSTSTGLFRGDTGEKFAGSEGLHIYIPAVDGADAERFLKRLHERCWLSGLGWGMAGAGGQFLRRSLVDASVFGGERLVFEGQPILRAPMRQDLDLRRPIVTPGPAMDTRLACADLSIVENAKLGELVVAERKRLGPELGKLREAFIETHAELLVKRTGCKKDLAKAVIKRQCEGILLPDIALPFDDPDLDGCTVRDVLADPVRFVGETLADPLEGRDYGPCKARIMQRSDGTLWVKSFAHGRTVYEMKFDPASVRSAIEAAEPSDVVDVLAGMITGADLNRIEEIELTALANTRHPGKVGVRAIGQRVRSVQKAHTQLGLDEARREAEALRNDQRIRLPVPDKDAAWLPQMQALDDVLGSIDEPEPPMRGVDGTLTQIRMRRIPAWHALTQDSANAEDEQDNHLPAPEQLLLSRMGIVEASELIERYIEHVDGRGRVVHMPKPFIEHYLTRNSGLPVVSGLSTLPVVLLDGTLLSRQGLDRKRGIVFRISKELLGMMPAREDCDEAAVEAAFRFLTDEFLVDVLTDMTGKCIIICAMLTIMERLILDERPTFFLSAGCRGSGKTTLTQMIHLSTTGFRASAAAWSADPEERRKAIFAYLRSGPAAIIWDNLPRGEKISCPHIERSCTTGIMEDRVLGSSEHAEAPSTSVHLFTGNNIGPKGDLASRALKIGLEVDRADPENRVYTHPDVIGWTEEHRGKILVALYTLMLGNKALQPGMPAAAKTRFKAWYRVVGSSIEHAAGLAGHKIDFGDLFLSQEDEEPDATSLADALMSLSMKWPPGETASDTTGFEASDVTQLINNRHYDNTPAPEKDAGACILEFLYGEGQERITPSAKSVGKRLMKFVGEPVRTTIDNAQCSITLMNKVGGKHATEFWLRLS
jgi:hypothetical protein